MPSGGAVVIRRARIMRGATEAQRLAAHASDADEPPFVLRRADDAPVGPALVPVDLTRAEPAPHGSTLPGHYLDARSES